MKRLILGTFVAASFGLLAVPLIAQNPLRQPGGGTTSTFLAEQPPHPVQLQDFSQLLPSHESPTTPSATLRTEQIVPPTPVPDVAAGEASPSGERHVVESQSFTVVSTTYKIADPNAQAALMTFLKQHIGKPDLFELSPEDHDRITVIASPKAQKTIGDLIGLMKQSPVSESPASTSPYETSGYSSPYLPSQTSQ